jgi:transcriptional regulator with PAS, ATPase and Fis domain
VVLSKDKEIAMENLMYHGINVKSLFWNSIGEKIKTLEEIEKEYIKSVLQAQNRKKSRIAEALGIDRKTLWAKIKKYNLE